MMAAQKAESEQEDHTEEGIHVRSIQAEEKHDIMSRLCSCKWQYRSPRIPQSVTLASWAVKKMATEKGKTKGQGKN